MEIEMKEAVGIEVTKGEHATVTAQEIHRRGLMAVGRRLIQERAIEARAGQVPRTLKPIEEEAVAVAAAGGDVVPAAPEARAQEPTPDAKRATALQRFLDKRKAEKRAAPLEEQIEAVWCALFELLGYPWMEDSCWEIEATYPDSVIVERAPGQYEQYPLTIDAANNVTLGAPVAVEATWSPIEAPAVPDDQAARGVPNSVNELRLRLSKA